MHPRLESHPDDPHLEGARAALRTLPTEEMPPYDWPAFRSRLVRRTDAGEAPSLWKPAALIAASLVVVIAVALWNGVGTPVGSGVAAQQHTEQRAAGGGAHWVRPDVAAGWLEALPDEPAIVRVDTHMAVTQLEDSIAWVDELITLERSGGAQPARVDALRQERSRLVDSLVRVRYAETLASEMH